MIFRPLPLAGACLIELQPQADDRGSFMRTFCRDEFAGHGLDPACAQSSVSRNTLRGTLRGMHFQADPHAECKLVRCSRGRLFDVIVDLRQGSPTRGRWHGTELDADRPLALYVPAGFAHGFLTLEDNTEVSYQISVPYRPEAARGFRWDDPGVAIAWPEAPRHLSERDRQLPAFADAC